MPMSLQGSDAPRIAYDPVIPVAPPAAATLAPPEPLPPTPEEAIRSGVLIVVSIPSQKLYVFKDGTLWDWSPVSTGKRGHATPTGAFSILQKRVRHRSNIYSNAPMPYMQRLTWAGVALHAGHVPGYPASHGCIRLPRAFAQKLFQLTDPASTAVLVSDQRLAVAEEAHSLVTGAPLSRMAAGETEALPSSPSSQPHQTVQLAAAQSPEEAASLWQDLQQRQPELRGYDHRIVPATVRSTRYYRLRASGPGAHALCARLTTSGVPCIRVI